MSAVGTIVIGNIYIRNSEPEKKDDGRVRKNQTKIGDKIWLEKNYYREDK